MSFLKFDMDKCTLCGLCVKSCPFRALSIEAGGITVNDACRMCKICVKGCPADAIRMEQKSDAFDKSEWKDFLIVAEQDYGDIHPVAAELIGEARKMAPKVGFKVNCVLLGGEGTLSKAEKLVRLGADTVYVYEDESLQAFRADLYTDVLSDLISEIKPSAVLIGGTALGRSLAPRLSTRFHTGLTADCTTLDIQENTDMVQIRPAFGGNIMAQISISHSRPQFATVRYRVLDAAKPVKEPKGKVVLRQMPQGISPSRVTVLKSELINRIKTIEEEDILVVAGRGTRGEKGVALCQELADALGGQIAYTRPMVENGFGTQAQQVGLSGRTVRPSLIITCGVSGAIQFTTCMAASSCIVAINSDPDARIFEVAHYCIVDDLFEVVPALTALARARKEEA